MLRYNYMTCCGITMCLYIYIYIYIYNIYIYIYIFFCLPYCISPIQGNLESPLIEWCVRRRRSALRIGLVRWDPVPSAGFEPRTSTSKVRRSTDWATCWGKLYDMFRSVWHVGVLLYDMFRSIWHANMTLMNFWFRFSFWSGPRDHRHFRLV